MVPSQLICVRHGQSTLNALSGERYRDPYYKEFREVYNKYPLSVECKNRATQLFNKYGYKIGDHASPLTQKGQEQARITGRELKGQIEIPEAIFISPYKRCQETFQYMVEGWPELASVPRIFANDNSLREMEFGEAFIYGNWDIFFAKNPIQKQVYDLAGHFWYRWPGGESVADVQARLCSWYDRIMTSFAEKRIMVISHFLTILALRANIEDWTADRFIEERNDAEHINCGVTEYKIRASDASNERGLVLKRFNDKLYPEELLGKEPPEEDLSDN